MEAGPEPIQEPKPPETSEPTVRVFGIPVVPGGSWSEERHAWRAKMRTEREAKRAAVGKDHHYYHHYHHRQGGGAIGGLLMLFAGAALLLNAAGILPWEFWNAVGPLWPGLLIVLGIQFILGWSWPARFISFIVALAIFSFIAVYGLLKIGSPLAAYIPQEVTQFIQSVPAFGNY